MAENVGKGGKLITNCYKFDWTGNLTIYFKCSVKEFYIRWDCKKNIFIIRDWFTNIHCYSIVRYYNDWYLYTTNLGDQLSIGCYLIFNLYFNKNKTYFMNQKLSWHPTICL